MNYKESGVDIAKGDYFIEKIKPFIKETYNSQVKTAVGGFAALYEIGDRYLASGTDGVGTKLKLACELNIHHTIGIDLVAMCVNDVLCTGATPLFFLDYLATSSLDVATHSDVIKGITTGCLEAGCALIGGETAEMPGMYAEGEYDLAGFCVGDVLKEKIIDGSKLKSGMKLYALSSSGFHSNGFSLVRRLIENSPRKIKQACLTPTKIYVKDMKKIMQSHLVYGLAHITGGGLNNIKRMNEHWGYQIDFLPQMPDFMEMVLSKSKLPAQELYQTFNMGLGFVFAADSVSKELRQELGIIEIGYITDEFKGVKVYSQMI